MEQIDSLYSKQDLISLFTKVGVKKGMTLEVHASLKSFGHVLGGSQTFNDALIELLGYNGTIVMPLHMSDRGEPSRFMYPPVDFSLIDEYRNGMPPFDKTDSETIGMSKIYENLRRRNKAEMTSHPVYPFVAYGKYAKILCQGSSSIHEPFNEKSIIKKLYDLKGYCLLAGVGFDSMTSLHLGEYLANARPYIIDGTSIKKEDGKCWTKFLDLDIDSDDGFLEIGQLLESKGYVSSLKEGSLELKLVPIEYAVKEAIEYYQKRYRYYRGDIRERI